MPNTARKTKKKNTSTRQAANTTAGAIERDRERAKAKKTKKKRRCAAESALATRDASNTYPRFVGRGGAEQKKKKEDEQQHRKERRKGKKEDKDV